MHITKNLLKRRAVVRPCKNFLLRALAGPRSCKNYREPIKHTTLNQQTHSYYFVSDIIYQNLCELVQHVSTPPGIVIRDFCESTDDTNKTNNITNQLTN
jgi:hypothetical protein